MIDGPVLVTGATGAQGGAVARHLLRSGFHVKVLTRDPRGAAAQTLLSAGAVPIEGDYNDPASVHAAVVGTAAVFSVQNPGPAEVQQGLSLIRASLSAGVQHFVQTSVTGTAELTAFPGWGSGRWNEDYWTAKWTIEEAVRHAGFVYHTILRPAFLMDNFLPPKVGVMFPSLRHGKIASALHGDTQMQLISAEDIGRIAAEAIKQPQRFNRHSIDLAAESLSIVQIAASLSKQLSRSIQVVELSATEAVASGQSRGWVNSQEWSNAHGYRASIERLEQYEVPLTRFTDWVAVRRDQFVFNESSPA